MKDKETSTNAKAFTIPPGYPDGSFSVGIKQGWNVIVTPAVQQDKGDNKETYTLNNRALMGD